MFEMVLGAVRRPDVEVVVVLNGNTDQTGDRALRVFL